ncbi:MAG: hypothetical protein IKQ91_07620 [Oscillospiraceae bacterium]|nr:hypothetical protein [Oscillospiraceae bacterium]
MNGQVIPACEVTEAELRAMFSLMDTYYDNMDESVFRRDFAQKDHCLILRNDAGAIVGFTTQKVMSVSVNGKTVHGVFSGDTIIHRDYRGQTDLFRVFSQYWFSYAERFSEFYWFLICKGYKTYGLLPLIWAEFYPNCRCLTPAYEQQIMDAYAQMLYPEEYNPDTGVIEYRQIKDKLKKGVAEIGSRQLKNPDTAFFCRQNPHHADGNDLVCLAKLDRAAVKPRMRKVLGI